MKKCLVYVVIICLATISCKKKSGDDVITVAAKTELNVAYDTDVMQKMDIYLPAGRSTTKTKVIVLIHGGAWTAGDKADFLSAIDTIKRRLPDYAIFNINYRLSANPNNIFPTQENDVKAAIGFIYGKKDDYLISDKFVLMGASAGAHLAMLYAYKNTLPVKAKAVVSFFGPSDLVDMYANPAMSNPLLSLLLANAVGKTPIQDPLIYFSSSPVNYISASSMPTILLHGGVDPLVNASQSVAVKNKLSLAGVTNKYVFYPTGGHGDWNAATFADAYQNIQDFLTTNVQ